MNTKHGLAIFIAFLTIFSSCKKENPSPANSNVTPNQSMTADIRNVNVLTGFAIDSSHWKALKITTRTFYNNVTDTTYYVIDGVDSSDNNFEVSFPIHTRAGAVPYKSSYNNWDIYNVTYYIASKMATYEPSIGSITLTSNSNGMLTGSFIGNFYNYQKIDQNYTLAITGQFNVKAP